MLNRGDRTASSKACFEELHQHGCLRRYTFWDTKIEGHQIAGVILKGERKDGTPKRTFAKKISIEKYYTNDADEFLTLLAAKVCGVPSPKIKLITAGHSLYQFSRDLSLPSSEADSPGIKFLSQKDLKAWDCKYELSDDSSKITHLCDGENPAETFVIDQYSIAKIAIAALVFDFRDLQDENIGVVVNHTAKTAAFAVIDIMAAPHNMPRVDFSKYRTLQELISNYPIMKKYFDDLPIAHLQEADLVRALNEIEVHMEEACSAVTAITQKHSIFNIIANNHIAKKIDDWKRNLETLKLFTINPCLVPKPHK